MRPRPLSLPVAGQYLKHLIFAQQRRRRPRLAGLEAARGVNGYANGPVRGGAGRRAGMRHTTIANLNPYIILRILAAAREGGEEERARKGKGGRAFIDDLIFRAVRKVCRPQRKIDSGVCPRL